MVNTKQGKSMIKASTVLSITLQDYHHSRQQYGNEAHNQSDRNKEGLDQVIFKSSYKYFKKKKYIFT